MYLLDINPPDINPLDVEVLSTRSQNISKLLNKNEPTIEQSVTEVGVKAAMFWEIIYFVVAQVPLAH